MFNIQKMMQQAQQVQFRLQEMQEKLKDVIVEGDAGGGLVKVMLACNGTLRGVQIDPSILTAEGREMVEDLLIAAHNNATEAKDARIQEETKAMMESLGLPEGAQLPI